MEWSMFARTLERELAAVTQERDQARQDADLLRRQIELVKPSLEWTNCEVCPARGQCCTAPRDDVHCGELIFAWAAQQAKEGGGK